MELENTMEDKELVAYDKFTPKVECKVIFLPPSCFAKCILKSQGAYFKFI